MNDVGTGEQLQRARTSSRTRSSRSVSRLPSTLMAMSFPKPRERVRMTVAQEPRPSKSQPLYRLEKTTPEKHSCLGASSLDTDPSESESALTCTAGDPVQGNRLASDQYR